jgi:GIY-YIG catalytic domain
MSEPIATREHVVYRFFDKNDRLLYVGCTVDLENRCNMHRGLPWFHKVARTTTTKFPNRYDALQAERQAICDEQGRLLYVGCAQSRTRLQAHLCRGAWQSEITGVHVREFATLNDALADEAAAPVAEQPLHNRPEVSE